MDLVRGIIGKMPNETQVYPTAKEWLANMTWFYGIPLFVSCIFMVIIFILGIVHLYFVLKFISDENIQTDLYWIVFMCPTVALCALIGMVLPRSAVFLYAIALVYFMLCIFAMVTLMTTLHGGRTAMCEKLMQNNIQLPLQVFPFTSICFCLPKLEANDFFKVTNAAAFLPLFVGSYGSYVVVPPGSQLLSAYRFLLMFRIVDMAQFSYSIQKMLFDFLAMINVFTDGPVLPSSGKAQLFSSFLLVVEMFLISVSGTFLFRPSKTIFFDRYFGSPGYRAEKLMSPVSMCCYCLSERTRTAIPLNSERQRDQPADEADSRNKLE